MDVRSVSTQMVKGRAADHAIPRGLNRMLRVAQRKPATRGGATLPVAMVTPGCREEGTVESTVVARTVGQPTPEHRKMAETQADRQPCVG